MSKMISRAAAARILGCTEQTVTNYVEKGMLDVSLREQKGRQGYFFDEDQVRALAPQLRPIEELLGSIENEKYALLQEKLALYLKREETRNEMLRVSGGPATWKHLCSLVAGAYIFVDNVKPITKDQFEKDVLFRLLSFESIKDIAKSKKTSQYRVKNAITSIARRMLKIPSLTTEYNQMAAELKRVSDENVRLKQALRFKAKSERVVIVPERNVTGTAQTNVNTQDVLFTKVDSVGLTKAALRALNKNNIVTIRDIVRMKETDFWDLPGVGQATVKEVNEVLDRAGLSFGIELN